AKMSKSLGNIIDPVEIIGEYGTDALRFSLISITSGGQDVFLSKEKFEIGRNFANKVWNASRFILMNLEDDNQGLPAIDKAGLSFADRWILSRLNRAVESVDTSLENFRFNEAASTAYEFFWHEFCDWYVEMVKPDMTNKSPEGARRKKAVQAILVHCIEDSLKVLHPFMPFVTEEIWQNLPHKGDSIMVSAWPKADKGMFDDEAEQQMAVAIGVISSIRNIRAELNIPPQKLCNAVIAAGSGKSRKAIDRSLEHIKALSRLGSLEITDKMPRPKASSFAVFGDCEICVPLEGLVDLEAERKKMMSKIGELEKYTGSIEGKLRNRNFTDKAPKEIVEAEKAKLADARVSLDKLKENLKRLEN
ncbi:MAG TPA: class I tRNA ligase family protein, partial [Candidatus Omnitrophota bacterium]|nr:class I tRNA ligase family protein [Candidatus Omnitrophota bacterium]